jgi:protein-L-isoaspartate(D-aspartate) O-methyltransferase
LTEFDAANINDQANNSNKIRVKKTAYSSQLQAMIKTIKQINAEIQAENPVAAVSAKVLQVMATIPRHKFLPKASATAAYLNMPLQIGYNQTISQPYIVALMTSLLALEQTSKVLEIGTGSGYQTAVLASLAREVYTIEIIPELYQRAKKIFLAKQYQNVQCFCQDGKLGLAEFAPFDAIIVTAAAKKQIPPNLLTELKIDGKLVIPIEDKFGEQNLFLIKKRSNNVIIKTNILRVRFVLMT